METRKFHQSVLPLVLCAVCMLLSRVSGILYSFFATDVLYSSSQLSYILQSLRQILHSVSVAFGASAALFNIMNKRKATLPVAITSVIILFDSIAAIMYDLLRNVLRGRVVLAIGYRFTLFTYEFIMLIAGLYIASLILKHKKSVSLAAVFAVALVPVIDLVYVLWNCLESLIEMEFLPYTDEIYTMVYETSTVLIAAVLSGVIGILIVKKYRLQKADSGARK